MLVLGLIVGEALGTFFDNEPTRTTGRIGENRVGIGDPAIADPLLVAVDLVPDDLSVFDYRICSGLQGAKIAARFGLGGAIGEEDSLFRDAA